jgi:glycine oxidase
MATADVVIIGGGVIGASIAFHLAERGVQVTLLERYRAGGHASRASAGLLHPITTPEIPEPLRALSAASFARFPELVARLREQSGIDPAYQTCGWLRVALGEEAVAALRTYLAAQDYQIRLIDGEEARRLEPALSPKVLSAVHAPLGAQVYVPALLQAYLHAAAHLGARIRTGVEVRALRIDGVRVLGVETIDGERIGAAHTVIAGGAWTAFMLAQLAMSVPVFPMRGQILSLHALPAPLRSVVFGSQVYLAPKVDGSVVVGATYEDAGFDDRLTAAGVAMLLGGAQEVVPVLADATFRQAWIGLRPASRDGLPFLGPVPGWEGVSVATGHTAEGVLLSPITGLLLAQHIVGQPPALALEPFSLARAL